MNDDCACDASIKMRRTTSLSSVLLSSVLLSSVLLSSVLLSSVLLSSVPLHLYLHHLCLYHPFLPHLNLAQTRKKRADNFFTSRRRTEVDADVRQA